MIRGTLRDPVRPRPGLPLASTLVGMLILSACALGDDAAAPRPEPVPPLPRELSVRPSPLLAAEIATLEVDPPDAEAESGEPEPEAGDDDPAEPETSATPTPDPEETEEPAGDEPPAARPSPSAPPSPSPTPAGPQTAGFTADGKADAGPDAPAFADLRAVTVASQGGDAIITVDLQGDVPGRLRGGEVMGVGVDLFVEGNPESDYQLFADGSRDGWFAYLQTPGGFVDYPGGFRLGASRMVFEVPWSSLGRADGGAFSAFADWSRSATPANAFGEDRAPDTGGADFRR